MCQLFLLASDHEPILFAFRFGNQLPHCVWRSGICLNTFYQLLSSYFRGWCFGLHLQLPSSLRTSFDFFDLTLRLTQTVPMKLLRRSRIDAQMLVISREHAELACADRDLERAYRCALHVCWIFCGSRTCASAFFYFPTLLAIRGYIDYSKCPEKPARGDGWTAWQKRSPIRWLLGTKNPPNYPSLPQHANNVEAPSVQAVTELSFYTPSVEDRQQVAHLSPALTFKKELPLDPSSNSQRTFACPGKQRIAGLLLSETRRCWLWHEVLRACTCSVSKFAAFNRPCAATQLGMPVTAVIALHLIESMLLINFCAFACLNICVLTPHASVSRRAASAGHRSTTDSENIKVLVAMVAQ
eukprot:6197483-Pleurochrysis_carterae.AAC.2